MGSIKMRRAGVVLLGVLLALADWALLDPVLGIDLQTKQGDAVTSVAVGAVGVVALLVGLAAWALLALLERFTSRARTVWLSIALVLLVLSFAGPLSSGTTTGAKLGLASLHLLVAAALIPGLSRTSSSRVPVPA